jgi:hypothetical protein
MNLFSGRTIVMRRKLSSQPRIIFTLDKLVSTTNLALASMPSRGRGSNSDTIRDTTMSPRRGARSIPVALLESSLSTARPMKSSM